MIDDLYSQLKEDSNIGIACLYADYKDQSSQTVVHILGSFLRQFLTTAQELIPEEVIQKLQNIRHQGTKVGTDDILSLLKIRLHQFKHTFICIDAVDELEPTIRQQLFKVLKELVTNNTRLFLTGRHHIESEVQKYLQVMQKYRVDISATQQDIQEFVTQQIMNDLNPEAMDEVLAKDTADIIIEKSQGM